MEVAAVASRSPRQIFLGDGNRGEGASGQGLSNSRVGSSVGSASSESATGGLIGRSNSSA